MTAADDEAERRWFGPDGDGWYRGVGYGHKPGEKMPHGGSVSGRWASRQEPELQRLDPFKRPWVKGPRPWQFKDRPKFQGLKFDGVIMDDVVDKRFTVDPVALEKEMSLSARRASEAKLWAGLDVMDFASIEKRLMAHYAQDAFYGTGLWHNNYGARAVAARREAEKAIFLAMEAQDASASTRLEASRQRALKSIRFKARWEHSVRQLP